ncbi:MAG: OpgC domain-containing protein [Methylobacteriaceae bacterium]|nr:OpgC domain-containing protein [Methylobacteriaceae bacterium]
MTISLGRTMPTELAKTIPSATGRDVRLDVFRGLAMFIIFVAHVPGNSWFQFIPARFGFSSSAELFVFCSGVASGYAFGGAFARQGFAAGARRVGRRVAQVYGAHLMLIGGLALASLAGLALLGVDYPGRLDLWPLLRLDPGAWAALLTFRKQPAYADILPLYIVVLAMIPAVVALARLSPALPLPLLAGLWLLANYAPLNLPANGGEWFFNPFAWQIVFFAGFAVAMGWVKTPPLRRGALFWLCAAFLAISVPLNFWAIVDRVTWIAGLREWLLPPGNQTYLSPWRFGHFLALAYVVLTLVDRHRAALARATWIVRVGQQSLPTFLASTILIWVGGMALDWAGREPLPTALVNLTGFAIIVAVACTAAALKRERAARRGAAPAGAPMQAAE